MLGEGSMKTNRFEEESDFTQVRDHRMRKTKLWGEHILLLSKLCFTVEVFRFLHIHCWKR